MKPYDDKLMKVIGLIKRSEPVMKDRDRFTDSVIDTIKGSIKQPRILDTMNELLFGWVYVGWVRRSLVVISLAIVFFFGYQQTILIRRVNELSERRMSAPAMTVHPVRTNYSAKLRLYRIFGGMAIGRGNKISEDQVEDFIRSVNDLKSEYRKLLEEMENDTTLRRYVEERIGELNRKKSKI